jgi:hypothetical protein
MSRSVTARSRVAVGACGARHAGRARGAKAVAERSQELAGGGAVSLGPEVEAVLGERGPVGRDGVVEALQHDHAVTARDGPAGGVEALHLALYARARARPQLQEARDVRVGGGQDHHARALPPQAREHARQAGGVGVGIRTRGEQHVVRAAHEGDHIRREADRRLELLVLDVLARRADLREVDVRAAERARELVRPARHGRVDARREAVAHCHVGGHSGMFPPAFP